ncbi:MAG: cyanophycin synthetase [uncultured bacterium (gcode 4)]|uniref:Cyanophycin synthetase n=1 Tax=uncultured bacterium (gcode 4) TaxID=1234023 RepID=K2H357_9BACT|nr:MAG: cyanophycin synthetase [uncultured bacterium (gcode 4)]
MEKLSPENVPHTNQRLLVVELQNRWVDVYGVDSSIELIKAVFRGREEYILDRFSSSTPHSQVEITADKYLSKKIMLANGISATKGESFSWANVSKAIAYILTELDFPVVLKPNWWSHWDDIVMNIDSISKFEDAVRDYARKFWERWSFLVEEQFSWDEYRIFIAANWDHAVLHRDPAYVIWDWVRNAAELAEAENTKRLANYKKASLCPIIIDPNIIPDPTIIPHRWQKLYVRSNSNLAKWGYSVDMTDIVHPSMIDIAKKVLSSFPWLPYAGIDMLSKDPLIEQSDSNYRILEVNSNPWLSMHAFPWAGKPRNVASIVADIIFPESVA